MTARVRSRIALTLVVGLAALTLTGCLGSTLAANTHHELEASLPGARFERVHAFHFGRITTALIKPIAHWAMRGDDEGHKLLRGLRRIDVAIYDVESFPNRYEPMALAPMETRLGENGWGRVLRTREEEEITWVFNRENGQGEIRDLMVLSLDGAEMVLVRVGGRVDQLLADLIAEDPGGFSASLGG